MRTLIVYESMFGNTHSIATAIADGMRSGADVRVVPVEHATAEIVAEHDLLVVGGPTHVHGMTSSLSRQGAVDQAEKSHGELTLDDDAPGPGLREWLDSLTAVHGVSAAAFDTRVKGNAMLTGRASKGIAARLGKHGYGLAAASESFFVDKDNHLLEGELDRAMAWGAQLAAAQAGAAT